MNNYTFGVHTNINCDNGKLVHHSMSQNKIFGFAYLAYSTGRRLYFQAGAGTIKDKINLLAFVSCGKNKYNKLQFEEFFNVYDKSVWDFLAAMVLTVSSLPRVLRMSNPHSCTKYFDSLISRL